jgi:hypothetical protein
MAQFSVLTMVVTICFVVKAVIDFYAVFKSQRDQRGFDVTWYIALIYFFCTETLPSGLMILRGLRTKSSYNKIPSNTATD